jgi:hypothetical protein
VDTADPIFNGLARLAWDIAVADDGTITATKDNAQVLGRLLPDDGSITWAQLRMVGEVFLHARLLDLRARALRAKKGREQATMPTGTFMPGSRQYCALRGPVEWWP